MYMTPYPYRPLTCNRAWWAQVLISLAMASQTLLRAETGITTHHFSVFLWDYNCLICSRKSLWGKEIAESPPIVDFNEIMNDETSRVGVGKWTKNIVFSLQR